MREHQRELERYSEGILVTPQFNVGSMFYEKRKCVRGRRRLLTRLTQVFHLHLHVQREMHSQPHFETLSQSRGNKWSKQNFDSLWSSIFFILPSHQKTSDIQPYIFLYEYIGYMIK